jgi:3-hydroxybutyrate dehydrogenase/3-oxoacyl-[acyl-carrier protein] reductase
MNDSIADKRALVVGGTGGIGRALAERLLGEGVRVTAFGRHSLPGVESVLGDADRPETQKLLLDMAEKSDILCVVRGPFLQKSLEKTTLDEWSYQAFANLALPGALVSAALPGMLSAQWGRILLFGGTRTEAVRGFRTNAAYAAAKTGVSSLVKSVALEYARQGIRCNGICPGFVDTPYLDDATRRLLAAKNPDGRLISTEEVAEMGVFLIKNPSCNGVLVNIDKGWEPSFI